MAKLHERIEAELANIQEVLNRFPPSEKLNTLKDLELAGVATLLHNFYNGIENVIKQIIVSKARKITPRPELAQGFIRFGSKTQGHQ